VIRPTLTLPALAAVILLAAATVVAARPEPVAAPRGSERPAVAAPRVPPAAAETAVYMDMHCRALASLPGRPYDLPACWN